MSAMDFPLESRKGHPFSLFWEGRGFIRGVGIFDFPEGVAMRTLEIHFWIAETTDSIVVFSPIRTWIPLSLYYFGFSFKCSSTAVEPLVSLRPFVFF